MEEMTRPEPRLAAEEEPSLFEPSPDDPTFTAGGALRLFMASRNYRTIRALKSVMTPALVGRYERDSAPFNGKNRVRIAAFDFEPKDLKPILSKGRRERATTSTGTDPGVSAYIAPVRSLWADQGEAVELREEAIRIVREDSGLWRIARLETVSSESLRYRSDLQGLVPLRRIMRAWHRRSLGSARRHLSPTFEKHYEEREDALGALFVGQEDPRHAAYKIVDLKDVAGRRLVAKLVLFDTSPGQPSALEGSSVILQMIKQGSQWLLDAWDGG
jgi:hypothetical protein